MYIMYKLCLLKSRHYFDVYSVTGFQRCYQSYFTVLYCVFIYFDKI